MTHQIDLRDIPAGELVPADLLRRLYLDDDRERAVWVLTRDQLYRLRSLSPPGPPLVEFGPSGPERILGLPLRLTEGVGVLPGEVA